MNPTRGNHDAMNVHPVEFIVGEYLHLAAMMVVPVHAATCLVFIVMLGVLTSLNHTRYDVKVPYGIFQVRNAKAQRAAHRDWPGACMCDCGLRGVQGEAVALTAGIIMRVLIIWRRARVARTPCLSLECQARSARTCGARARMHHSRTRTPIASDPPPPSTFRTCDLPFRPSISPHRSPLSRAFLSPFLPAIPLPSQVRWHDLHHRLPQSNYGQYTMFWDHLWGSYREDKDLAKAS